LGLASKKVLITGIESFTGKHLSTYLKSQGYEVSGTTYKDCDITVKEELEKVFTKFVPDYIIHLAGISFAAHSNTEEFYKVNTIGTLNILETLVELDIKPKKIILASSATVYGNQHKEILDESLCPMPANHYGASKYAMETLARNFFNKLDIIITRPFNYTGVGQEEYFLIPKIVSHYKDKKSSIELGNLDVAREFNDVDDIVKIYKQLLEVKDKSISLNLASNRPIKLLDIIDYMNDIAGYKIEVKINKDFVRADEIKSLCGDMSLLSKIIALKFDNNIKQTLTKMYNA